ncbi:hypothetical protein [Halomicronema sp. CCY15110]|uniref:hypothetical protein n=1 Tax=Halomicronema sp. CCY15110 TaxID=2767773 RepID=UPI0019517C60|nr:hypothetical protein [Halomicronema sp. CCY15110]
MKTDSNRHQFTLTITIDIEYRHDYLTPEKIISKIGNAIYQAEDHPDWGIPDLDYTSSDPEPLEIPYPED